MPRYVRVEAKQLDTDLVFSAASAAYRLQGYQYKKVGSSQVDSEGREVTNSNRELLGRILQDQSLILPEDQEHGRKVRQHYQGLSFKILSGKILGELDSKALALSSGTTVSEREIGVISYLPEGYEVAQARRSVDDRIQDAAGGVIGKIGDKVKLEIEVLRSVFSQNFGVYFITAITKNEEVVFFAFKQSLDAGVKLAILGRVKAHRGSQTQLNRVRVVSK